MTHKRWWIAKCLILLCLSTAALSCRKSFIAIPHPGYAIGVVESYAGIINHASIFFHFTVGGKTIHTGYPDGASGWTVPDVAAINDGDMYMVQYDTVSVSNARMLFCYKVTDSAQYIKYVAQFTANPPTCH